MSNPLEQVSIIWRKIKNLSCRVAVLEEGGAGNGIQTIVEGTNIDIDNTDPQNPIISVSVSAGLGDVVGPSSSLDNTIAIFDGTTGKLIQDSGILISDIGGAVDSVNGETGTVVLDADDIDDTSTTNKFVTASDVTKLSNLSGTNTGDQDLSSYVTLTGTQTLTNKILTNPTINSTVNITDSTNKRFVTDANLTTIGNQSGTNTGDESTASIKTKLSISTLSGSNTGDQDLSTLLVKSSNLSDLTSVSTARTNLGLGTLATQSGTFSGSSSGTNTGDSATNTTSNTYADAKVADAINDGTTTIAPSQNAVFDALALKVDKETFTTLTYGSTTNWDANTRQNPLAKVTATGNFTLNLTNVKSGSIGILKITTNTASAITITFGGSGLTHFIGNVSLSTYTLPAGTGKDYFLQFTADGTILEWVINDYSAFSTVTSPFARASRISTTQSIAQTTYTAIAFDTEIIDNANIYSSGNPTRFTIPGTGNKIATMSIQVNWPSDATGQRRVLIYKNGTQLFAYFNSVPPINGASMSQFYTPLVDCAGGDYLEVYVYHSSTVGALLINAYVSVKVENY